ncbi:transposase [Streptomyces sp. NPDC057694]|uniref:IS110 family transposase n=1 Tax=Streptomyces sp. NPDC057694 TaxID=3346216 RepID=UPI0036A39DFF
MADQIAAIDGVDTHTEFHQTAVIDSVGRRLATAAFPTTPDDCCRLLDWMSLHADVLALGVEGTGAYGGELTRFLRASKVTVVDVDRPGRKARRANGGRRQRCGLHRVCTRVRSLRLGSPSGPGPGCR